MLRTHPLLVLICSFPWLIQARAQTHFNSWFRGTLAIPVEEKLQVDAEFQHRRQNGFSNNNLFDKKLLFTFRTWVHYQPKEGVKYSLSPVALFLNYKPIQSPGDDTLRPGIEFRFSAAVELQKSSIWKTSLVNRTALECRIFENALLPVLRLRNRTGLRYNLTKKWKLGIYDELILNIGGTSLNHFFDQNRIGCSVEYDLIPRLKVEAGFLYLVRLQTNEFNKLRENNLVLNLTYRL
ncbi:DUF2490 domain-containing protein [Fluviicola sp.]|uniref:DUF2490 domain-containing protein n=1 Tax=Fluviicola sp. TaxID=1917219 RepID=UPI0031E2DAC9